RFLRRYDRIACGAALLMVPIQAACFIAFNRHVYHGPEVSLEQTVLACAIGWMYLLQVRETFLITTLHVRLIVAGSCIALGSYIGIMLLIQLSGVTISLTACLGAVAASRLIYLIVLRIMADHVLNRLSSEGAGVVVG